MDFDLFPRAFKVWGGEHIHVGLYTKLEGEDGKLEGVPRITAASSLSTQKLLAHSFPKDGPSPADCTLVDLGSGYGGTARVAAKELGCKVRACPSMECEGDPRALLKSMIIVVVLVT